MVTGDEEIPRGEMWELRVERVGILIHKFCGRGENIVGLEGRRSSGVVGRN